MQIHSKTITLFQWIIGVDSWLTVYLAALASLAAQTVKHRIRNLSVGKSFPSGSAILMIDNRHSA